MDMLGRHVARHGYPNPPEVEIDPLLLLSGDDLLAKTNEELGAIEYDLSKAAFSIADEYNRQKAKEERCRTELAELVGDRLDGKIYGRDDKWLDAARRDDEAWGWWLAMQNYRTVCLRLEGQSMRLNEIVRAVSNIIFSRR